MRGEARGIYSGLGRVDETHIFDSGLDFFVAFVFLSVTLELFAFFTTGCNINVALERVRTD